MSAGTFGIQSLKSAYALFIDCVRRLSFLLAVVRLLTTRTNGGACIRGISVSDVT